MLKTFGRAEGHEGRLSGLCPRYFYLVGNYLPPLSLGQRLYLSLRRSAHSLQYSLCNTSWHQYTLALYQWKWRVIYPQPLLKVGLWSDLLELRGQQKMDFTVLEAP